MVLIDSNALKHSGEIFVHSWNMGYSTDNTYTSGYFHQLNPYFIKFLFTASHATFPEITDDFTACELGYGTGISIVTHAAASNVKWYGTDFMPEQTLFAEEFAKMADVPVNLSNDSFAEYLKRKDLPKFDVICLHGIWSWVNKENQDIIIEFIRTHLKLTGVVFISYNIAPFYTSFAPVRHLMLEYKKNLSSKALSDRDQVPHIGKFIKQICALNPGYLRYSPATFDHIQTVFDPAQADPTYIAHEFLNDSWDISHHDVMLDNMDSIKLSYVCSSNFMATIDEKTLSKEERDFINPYIDTKFALTLRDLLTNGQFRTDYFVKGKRFLDSQEFGDLMNKNYFVLVQDPKHCNCVTKTRLEEHLDFTKDAQSLLEFMDDYQPRSFGQIREALSTNATTTPSNIAKEQYIKDAVAYAKKRGIKRTLNDADLYNVLLLLIHNKIIAPAPAKVCDKVVERCHQLNHAIIKDLSAKINYLAVPATGGALAVDQLTKVILSLHFDHQDLDAEGLAKVVLQEHHYAIKFYDKDNNLIEDEVETLARLKETVDNLLSSVLPRLKALHAF